MTTLVEYLTHYLQDGTPRKLIHIVNAAKALGWNPSVSSQYIGVYQCMRNRPDLFERVSVGEYRMITNTQNTLCLDQDQLREVIFDLLKKKSKRTVAQVWRALQDKGLVVGYSATQYLLQADMFTKDGYSRYSNEK